MRGFYLAGKTVYSLVYSQIRNIYWSQSCQAF